MSNSTKKIFNITKINVNNQRSNGGINVNNHRRNGGGYVNSHENYAIADPAQRTFYAIFYHLVYLFNIAHRERSSVKQNFSQVSYLPRSPEIERNWNKLSKNVNHAIASQHTRHSCDNVTIEPVFQQLPQLIRT